MTRSSRLPWLLAIAAAVIALDRYTKNWVSKNIPVGHMKTVIPGVFHLSHALNEGAAFSLFADSGSTHLVRWALVAFSLFAALVTAYFLVRMGKRITPATVAIALILGGALGNAWDRVLTGKVIDFLAVYIAPLHYDWPDFNVADSAIVTGACLLLLDAMFQKQTEK